ncbi:MAG: folate-binding protein [Candidatus Aquirickettsiella gammari]|uniref:Folate-binding protein n=1 Tax=Candidatus Aquirickettsiella gammari TaxID=2016198 RepID=A0A370CJH0_9COXI|nr:MAG: folate-binding protein [Candidatus Aquirickettsiella gammari]
MIEATKNNCIDLSDLGLLQVTGKHAKQFLQGQLTCNLEEVNEHQTRLGAHCDVKGRVQATFRLFFYQNAYYFLLPRHMVQHLLVALKKYAVFSKVDLSDVSDNWQKMGVYGSGIATLLRTQKLYTKEENGLVAHEPTLSLSIPGPSPRFILLSSSHKSITSIVTTCSPQTLNDWYLFDIMAGIPTIYPETSAEFTPHQLNYPALGGVSFNKGCYIGQEIIARTQYLGKPKSRLYRVSFQANKHALPGTSLLEKGEQTRKGTVIMSAKDGFNHYQALVCLQNQAISHTIYLGNAEASLINLLKLPYSI